MDSLLKTKVALPVIRRNLVRRPRLLSQLERGLRRRLTLVSAPAGFGKTTLLAAWAKDTQARVAWLSLDESDNDPVRFLDYVTGALETVDVGGENGIQVGIEAGRPLQLEQMATALINQIDGISEELVLVLDDYHLIVDAAVHDLVTFLLEHLPSNLHLVIATRADPPLPLARLRGRGQINEIRASDLRFTQEEAIAFLNEVMGLDLALADVARLTHRTEGWVVGLQMAALSMQGRRDLSSFIQAFEGSHRYIMDYLMAEVLEQQPEPVQAFLLQTSILDQLTAPLCDAVRGGTKDAQAVLESLERSNLFILPLDDRREWFRYHRLFADLLRRRLERDEPALAPEFHRRAAQWYAAHGMQAEAIEHVLAIEDFDWAADLIATTAEATLARSELATFRRWLAPLPEEEICRRPDLCIYQAWALFWSGRQIDEVERWLGRLTELEDHQVGQVAVLRALMSLYRGMLPETAAQVRVAVDHLESDDVLFRGMVSALDVFVLLDEGDISPADEEFLNHIAREAAALGNIMAAVITLSALGESHVRQGRLAEAEVAYRRAVDLADDGRGGLLPAAGQALTGLGVVALMRNELALALDFLQKGVELGRSAGQIVALDGLVYLARAQQAAGDPAGAQATLGEAMNLAIQFDATDVDDRMVGIEQARSSVLRGDLAPAHAWAEEHGLAAGTRFYPPESREARFRKYELIVAARVYLAEGRYEEALQAVKLAQSPIEARGRRVALAELLLLKALAHDRLKDASSALEALERALGLAAPGGYIRVFLDAGADLLPLLRQALAQGITPTFTRRVVAALAGVTTPEESQRASGARVSQPVALIEPLTERELEVLALLPSHLSSSEIADRLYIATSTARTHIKNVYGKLAVHSRDEAVQRARELGLI
ncbi:MAG: LuxR C-terminal-related transcriptional regulator [Anaerolineae bacterium]